MNWDVIGAAAEFIGAVAVFGSLIYLAIQIRQSNIITREQAQYHILQNQITYFDRLADDPDLVRTAYGFDLTDSEVQYRQHEANTCSILFRWNWEYVRVQEGIYGVMDLPIAGFRWQFKTIGIDRHWEDKKAWFDPRFIEFMEQNVIPYADNA
jgi:hypothetical protein